MNRDLTRSSLARPNQARHITHSLFLNISSIDCLSYVVTVRASDPIGAMHMRSLYSNSLAVMFSLHGVHTWRVITLEALMGIAGRECLTGILHLDSLLFTFGPHAVCTCWLVTPTVSSGKAGFEFLTLL